MNNKNKIIKDGFKNSVIVIFSQMLLLILSFFTSFLLPKFLGVTDFGYWQIYLFYTSYVGFFHFGFNDGVYLRYGHLDYKDLPEKLLRSSIRIYVFNLIMISLIMSIFVFFESDPNKQFALSMTVINIFVVCLSSFFIYIFQFTNQIKKYSVVTILNRVIFVAFLVVLFALKTDDFKLVILSDLVTRTIILMICVFSCRDIIWGKHESYSIGLKEYWLNLRVGINLMLANIMGMLITGIGRLLVERFMSVEDFGLYSFANTATNLTLIFINAISLVLYPTLKRLSYEEIPQYYSKINTILCALMYSCLLFYFPIYLIIEWYLSAYSSILDYLFILFPIVIANAKLSIVINTYYKTLREEKAMFKANVSSIIMFLVLVLPMFYLFKSVKLIVICTLITMLWRCYVSEIFLKKKMRIEDYKNIIQEILLIIIFLIFNSFENLLVGFIGYSFFFIIYLLINYKTIKLYLVKIIQMLLKKN